MNNTDNNIVDVGEPENPEEKIVVSPLAASVLLVLLGGIGGVTATLLVSTVLWCIGFTAVGVSGGSYAAAWQSSIGSVAAGSLFASLTSIAMSGTSAAIFVPGALLFIVKPLVDLINGVERDSYTYMLLNQIHNIIKTSLGAVNNAAEAIRNFTT